MPTFACPAACGECGTLSSPRDRTTLDLASMVAAIDEAKDLGFHNVVFTGGEATLRWADLLAGVAHAHRRGLPVRLVTNAHWAFDLARARKKITGLIEAGLDEINYSSGDEHARFVPVDRVAYAIVAACERSLPVHVMVELKNGNAVTRDQLLDHPALARLSANQAAHLTVRSSPWMPLSPMKYHRYPPGLTVDHSNIGLRPGCDSVLQTYTVQADGRIGACCGLGLRRIDELNVARVDQPSPLRTAIREAEQDFLKLWIHYEGPERVVAWAAERDPSIKWEGRYAHHCQMCQRLYHDEAIRAVLREHWQEAISQVLQSAWFDEVLARTVLRARPVDAAGS
ncbi:radical SAM protein [Micromonospora sp. NPDC051196]|uniref:radical SAM protein n=1 Tax=Micromonospora sp. NPDC051196 TaxID=3155281 RepID=UPI0034465063